MILEILEFLVLCAHWDDSNDFRSIMKLSSRFFRKLFFLGVLPAHVPQKTSHRSGIFHYFHIIHVSYCTARRLSERIGTARKALDSWLFHQLFLQYFLWSFSVTWMVTPTHINHDILLVHFSFSYGKIRRHDWEQWGVFSIKIFKKLSRNARKWTFQSRADHSPKMKS